MKFILWFAPALLLANSASALITPDYAAFKANLTAQATQSRSYLISSLNQGQYPYYQSYNYTRSYYINALSSTGPGGVAVSDRLVAYTDWTATKIAGLYNLITIAARVDLFWFINQNNYTGPMDADVFAYAARSAIPFQWNKVQNCWNTYKSYIRNEFLSFNAAVNQIIQNGLNNANTQAQALNATIYADIQALENQVVGQCGNNGTCILEYFVANEAAIKGQIDSYYNQIVNVLSSTLDNIAAAIKSRVNTGRAYLDQIDASIRNCYG